jgi:fructose-1,6-bisphosphatase/inositol monophosphatase family enzyme
LEDLRDLAAVAAETGGRIVGEAAGRDAEASDKGLPGDYVTEVDLASERAIRELLARETPACRCSARRVAAGRATDTGSWIPSTGR